MKEKLRPVSAMFAVLIAARRCPRYPARADDVQNYLDRPPHGRASPSGTGTHLGHRR